MCCRGRRADNLALEPSRFVLQYVSRGGSIVYAGVRLVCRTTAGEMILRCGRIGIAIFNSTVVWIRKKKNKIDYHQGTLIFGRVRAYYRMYLQESGSGRDKERRVAVSGRPPANSNAAAAIKAGVLGPEVFQARNRCTRLHKPQSLTSTDSPLLHPRPTAAPSASAILRLITRNLAPHSPSRLSAPN